MKQNLFFIFLGIFLLNCGCGRKSPELFKLKFNLTNSEQLIYYYVINNPPEDSLSLIKLIDNFNSRELKENMTIINSKRVFNQVFYEEGCIIDRDYMPKYGSYFNIFAIDDIREDDSKYNQAELIIYTLKRTDFSCEKCDYCPTPPFYYLAGKFHTYYCPNGFNNNINKHWAKSF